MANRSHVPKFGNWDDQDNVPYIAYFDKARKGRAGGQIRNPNDPEDNRSVLSDNPDSGGAPPPVSKSRNDQTNPVRQGTARSREEVGMRRYPEHSPNMGHSTSWEANVRSASSEKSDHHSPLNHHARPRDTSSSEGTRSYDSRQGTPAKTQMKPANNGRSNDSSDRAAAVPKFGDWNNDPTSAEAFADIFMRVRAEKHAERRRETELRSPRPYADSPTNAPVRKKSCCFPWI